MSSLTRALPHTGAPSRTRTVHRAADECHARLVHRLDGHAQQLVRVLLPPVVEAGRERAQVAVDVLRLRQPARLLQALADVRLHEAERARVRMQRTCGGVAQLLSNLRQRWRVR
jgi:hypothetical protein